jgi:hypothetical protein
MSVNENEQLPVAFDVVMRNDEDPGESPLTPTYGDVCIVLNVKLFRSYKSPHAPALLRLRSQSYEHVLYDYKFDAVDKDEY